MNEAAPASKRSKMVKRVGAGLLIAGSLLAAVIFGPPVLHLCLLYVFALVAGWECFGMLAKAGLPPFRLLGMVCGGLWMLLLVLAPPGAEGVLVALGAVILAVLLRQICHGATPDAAQRMAGTLFGFFYVFVLFSFAFLLLWGGSPGSVLKSSVARFSDLFLLGDMSSTHYVHLVVFTIVVTKCTDAGAYFAGSFFGSHKMAPKLSPGKTWEGIIGGVIVALGVAFLYAHLLNYQFSGSNPLYHFEFQPWQIAVIALSISAMSVFGDLAESVLKRAAKVKDSGQLAPGIGGALDMIDSTLFTFPVMFFYLQLWHL